MAGGLAHAFESTIRLDDSRLDTPKKVHVHVFKIDYVKFFDTSRCDGLVVSVLVELLLLSFGDFAVKLFAVHFLGNILVNIFLFNPDLVGKGVHHKLL